MSQTKTNKTVTSTDRKAKSIKGEEIIKLWVKAGGRCEYPGCNEYLLQDELTAREYNFGQMAHNVGRKKTKGSPRGMDSLPIEDRDKAENHLLCCGTHHTLIDTGKFLEFYTVKQLRQYKEAHENRIKYLTGLGEECSSVVLRMMNRIHGDSVSISNEEILNALLTCANRYPKFLLQRHNNLEIDLTALSADRTPSYWESAVNIIDEVIEQQIKPQVKNQIFHLSIFALAPIPLMIYLGFKLGDKITIDVYQKQHNLEEIWVWCEGSDIVTFEYKKVQQGTNASNVAVILSISGKVSNESYSNELDKSYTIYELTPVKIIPNRDIVQNKETVLNFRKTYQLLLREIESNHSSAKNFKLFPAVPVSVAIYCGRNILKAVTPKPIIYENIKNKFVKAISLT